MKKFLAFLIILVSFPMLAQKQLSVEDRNALEQAYADYMGANMRATAPVKHPFYLNLIKDTTFTFQPQFGDTMPFGTAGNLSSGSLATGTWVLRPTIFDLKYQYQFNIPDTQLKVVKLIQQSFTFGVDYGMGPASAGFALNQPIYLLSTKLQNSTTVFISIKITGQQVVDLLHAPQPSAAQVTAEKDRALQEVIRQLVHAQQ